MQAALIVFLCLLVANATFGYMLTWLPTLTDDNWRVWTTLRVGWALGSALGVAVTWASTMGPADTIIGRALRRFSRKRASGMPRQVGGSPYRVAHPPAEQRPASRRWGILGDAWSILTVAFWTLPIGALICAAPLWDIVRGPIEQEVTAVRVSSYTSSRRTVTHRVEVDLASGETLRAGGFLSAPHAPTWERLAAPCTESGRPMRVRFLRAMMAPLTIECLPGG